MKEINDFKGDQWVMTEMTIIGDGEDIYVAVDGLRVAVRGRPHTSQARTWVPLEPGWHVTGTVAIKVSYDQPEGHA